MVESLSWRNPVYHVIKFHKSKQFEVRAVTIIKLEDISTRIVAVNKWPRWKMTPQTIFQS